MIRGTEQTQAPAARGGRSVRVAAVVVAWALVVFLVPDPIAAAVLNPMGAALAVAFVAGIDRVRNRTCWNCMVIGAGIYAATDVLASLDQLAGISVAGFVIAYSWFAVAAARYVGPGRAAAPRGSVVNMPRAGRRSIERLARAA